MMGIDHHERLVVLANTVHAYCADIWEFPTKGGLLVFWGPNGSGKTKAAKAIGHWVRGVGCHKSIPVRDGHKASLSSYFGYWPTVLDEMKSGAWKLIDVLIESPVLILDEIGGAHDPSQVGVDKLGRILSEREGKWTVITTNTPPSDWEAAFDIRVASRLIRDALVIDLSGVPDYSLIQNKAATPSSQRQRPSGSLDRPFSTTGFINVEFPCCFCGKIIKTKADPSAGQEWVDKLASMTACNSCYDGRMARISVNAAAA